MKKLLLATTLLFLSVTGFTQKDSTQLVTTWRTFNATPFITNPSGDSSVHLGIDTTRTYNYDVDWDNDGVFDILGVTTAITHRYPDTGTYTIRIRGQFPRVVFGDLIYYYNGSGLHVKNDCAKLVSLDQWGTTVWEDLFAAFYGCQNLQYNAVDIPNLSLVTRLDQMFSSCSKFNGAIGNWDVSRVKNMKWMFYQAREFNQDLSNWRIDSVTDMEGIFAAATNFNQSLSSWNVSNVTTMKSMFRGAYDFNQDISSWDVSSVKDMSSMFEYDSSFNQDISTWQVDSVVRFEYMFRWAGDFNQDISTWNVDSAVFMRSMFEGASSFDQDLSNWDILNRIKNLYGFFDNSGISIHNYDAMLASWESRIPATFIFARLGAAGLTYCLSDSIRNELRLNNFITIGDSLNCIGVGVAEDIASESEEGFIIYPNPTKGVFTLDQHSPAKTQEVFIYNMQGQLVYSVVLKSQKQQINLTGFGPGIYLLRVGEESKRLVVY